MQELSENSSFSQRMKYFMKSKRITAENIADKLGLTKGAVTHWSNGIRFPKTDIVEGIANALDENIIDFFPNSKKHREEIVRQELEHNIEEYLDLLPATALPSSLKTIPIHRGYPTTNNIVQEECMPFVKKIFVDKRMIVKQYQDEPIEAVVIVGDSMTPYLNNGDVALCFVTKEFLGAGKYVVETPHGLELRSVAFLRDGSLQLSSENPTYPTEAVPKTEVDTIEFFGLVVGRILKS